MFARLGSFIDGIVGTYSTTVSANLCGMLVTPAIGAITLWALLHAYAIMRGEASEAIPDIAWRFAKIVFITSIALGAGTYQFYVIGVVDDLQASLANGFVVGGSGVMSGATAWAALDNYLTISNELLTQLQGEILPFGFDALLATLLFAFSSLVFLLCAFAVILISKITTAFVVAIGPVFILTLLFKPTARLFDSWLSMVLSTIVLIAAVTFAVGLGVATGRYMYDAIVASGGIIDGAVSTITTTFSWAAVSLGLGIFVWNAPSVAAALTSGGAVGHGANLVSSVVMMSMRRSPDPNKGGSGDNQRGGSVSDARRSSTFRAGAAVARARRSMSHFINR